MPEEKERVSSSSKNTFPRYFSLRTQLQAVYVYLNIDLYITKSFFFLLKQALGPISYTKTCLYTMTYDRDFLIDSLASKGLPQIIVCCGAGHAYK